MLWLPRADEAELAQGLGLIERSPAEQAAGVNGVAADLRRDGHAVHVGRWHVWRLVRAMASLGAANNSEGRAAAAGMLYHTADQRREG